MVDETFTEEDDFEETDEDDDLEVPNDPVFPVDEEEVGEN